MEAIVFLLSRIGVLVILWFFIRMALRTLRTEINGFFLAATAPSSCIHAGEAFPALADPAPASVTAGHWRVLV